MSVLKNGMMGFLASLLLLSCEKWKDPSPTTDPRITSRKYCNDPQAVNYNWDFPGVADSTVCIYSADLFEGNYTYTDSIYSIDNLLDTSKAFRTVQLQLVPLGKNKLKLSGYCTNDLFFTTLRNGITANADTTIKINDSTYAYGQLFCRAQDTLTGTLTRLSDSLTHTLSIQWTVVSDTAIRIHKGRATKL